MAFQVDAQAAYVLHSRPYRDTSALVDFFTLEHGKVSAVVKGARNPKSKFRAVLQPFTPLQISWRGRQELKTLITAEAVAAPVFLTGSALLCGLYVNELLERLLQNIDPHPRLYVYYQYVLNELLDGTDIEVALRVFERQLLQQLGYDFDFSRCLPERHYYYHPEQGFCQTSPMNKAALPAELLQAMGREEYTQAAVRKVAKRLMRQVFDHLLGHQRLRSRELFTKISIQAGAGD